MLTAYEIAGLKKLSLNMTSGNDYISKYLGLSRTDALSGFFGDFTNSLGSLFTTSNIATVAPLIAGGVLMLNHHLSKKYALPIIGGALGLAALGHSLTNTSTEVKNAVSSGVNSTVSSAKAHPELLGATIQSSTSNKPITFGTALGQIAASGLKIAIMQKIAKASESSGVSQQQIYNSTLAYVTAHQKEFQDAGYSTPNEAAVAILGKTDGAAPNSNTSPCSYISNITCDVKNYLPYIAIGGGLLLVILMNKKD